MDKIEKMAKVVTEIAPKCLMKNSTEITRIINEGELDHYEEVKLFPNEVITSRDEALKIYEEIRSSLEDLEASSFSERLEDVWVFEMSFKIRVSVYGDDIDCLEKV